MILTENCPKIIKNYEGLEAQTVEKTFRIFGEVEYKHFFTSQDFDFRENTLIEDTKKKIYGPCLLKA